VRGGGGMNIACTTGFSVQQKHGTTRGVLTAAHCSGNYVTYYDGNSSSAVLLSLGSSWTASTDVQWYKPYGFCSITPKVEEKFYGISGTVPHKVTGFITRAGTHIGKVVCHRGITTGYSCGRVVSKMHTLNTPHCGPPLNPVPCANTCISVGPLQDPQSTLPDLNCAGGDSGGPWFSGTLALGIQIAGPKDGPCIRATYMSIDYIDSLGVELLYGPE